MNVKLRSCKHKERSKDHHTKHISASSNVTRTTQPLQQHSHLCHCCYACLFMQLHGIYSVLLIQRQTAPTLSSCLLVS
jgi:predicted hotdog family 3-hydroxylacyl-ACP dehydratase